MEDVLTISRGVPVESNAQLVERAVEVGRLAQRTPMTTAEARELLGVKDRGRPWLRKAAAPVTKPRARSSCAGFVTGRCATSSTTGRSVDEGLDPVGQDLLGEDGRAGDAHAGRRSAATMPRRWAHWVQTVTCPPATTAASRSASGAARAGRTPRPAGDREPAASPVSHSPTSAPAATAAAATVNAWLQRSASSAPQVTLRQLRSVRSHAPTLEWRPCRSRSPRTSTSCARRSPGSSAAGTATGTATTRRSRGSSSARSWSSSRTAGPSSTTSAGPGSSTTTATSCATPPRRPASCGRRPTARSRS